MIGKFLTSSLALSLAALTACSASGHKMKMNHNLSGDNTKTAFKTNNAEINTLLTGKNCIPLSDLVATLGNENNGVKTYTVYIKSRAILDPIGYSKDEKESIALLVAKVPSLLDYPQGVDLKNSALVGKYLNVAGTSSCDQVSFNIPGGQPGEVDTFKVQKGIQAVQQLPTQPAMVRNQQGKLVPNPQQQQQLAAGATPGRLSLANDKGETREYTADGEGNLIIDVVQMVPGEVGCTGSPSTVTVSTRYVLNMNATDSGLNISKSWAKLLVAAVKDSGSLKGTVASLKTADDKIDSRGAQPGQTPGQNSTPAPQKPNTTGGVPVSTGDLWVMQNQIKAGTLNTISCTQ